MPPESKSEDKKTESKATAKTAAKASTKTPATLKESDLTKGERAIYDRLIEDEGADKAKALEEIQRRRGATGPIESEEDR